MRQAAFTYAWDRPAFQASRPDANATAACARRGGTAASAGPPCKLVAALQQSRSKHWRPAGEIETP